MNSPPLPKWGKGKKLFQAGIKQEEEFVWPTAVQDSQRFFNFCQENS